MGGLTLARSIRGPRTARLTIAAGLAALFLALLLRGLREATSCRAGPDARHTGAQASSDEDMEGVCTNDPGCVSGLARTALTRTSALHLH